VECHFGENAAKGVFDAVVRHEDAGCMVYEVMEVKQVHGVVLKSRRECS